MLINIGAIFFFGSFTVTKNGVAGSVVLLKGNMNTLVSMSDRRRAEGLVFDFQPWWRLFS
jgi:hypothetical protein